MGSMKFLVILALAVAVSAEADPQLLYNYPTAAWPATSYIQKPLVTSYVQKPLVYTKPVITKPVEYHAASPGVSHTVLKREAEAYYPYMHTTYTAPVYTAPVYSPYGVKTPTYSNDAITPFGYAAKGQYVANSAGVVHVAKREAEADAQVLMHTMPVTTYAHQPVVYKQPVQPVVYTKPVVYNTPLVTPVVHKIQPVNYMAGSYADDSVKPFDYAAKGKYIANSAGTIHKAKREAEAEADPALIYSGLGYHGLGYSGLGYSPVSTYGIGAYPYSTYHYGKREAEAEPQYMYGYNGLYNGYSSYSPYTYGLRTYGGYTGRYFW